MLRRETNNLPGGNGDILTAERKGDVSGAPNGIERRRSDRSRLDSQSGVDLSAFREDTSLELDRILAEGLRADFGGDENFSEHEAAPDRRATDNQSMAHLRARREWTVAPEEALAEDGFLAKLFGSHGALKSPRWQALSVAVVCALLAGFIAAQTRPAPAPAPAPVQQVVEPAVEIQAEPRIQVLVANENIRVGERLSAGSVGWADWPEAMLRPDYITVTQSPDALTEIENSAARYEIFAGEPVREAKLVRASSGYLSTILEGGMRGVSVSVSANSASGGFIRPDDHVDVVLTKTSALGLSSETVLRNVRVLAINAQLGESSSEVPQGGDGVEGKSDVFINQAIATLALNPEDAEVLINASASGNLSLVLRSVDDFAEPSKAGEQGVNQSIRLSSPFWNAPSGQPSVR